MLHHPYILRIFAVEPEKKSRPYIVMEYLQGQTLAALLREVHPLPEPDAVKIASRICEALDYMHVHKIVHRDLKPQNIMICNDGSIRIMDFGIAKSLKMRRLTFVGFSPSMGTPDYMAPEQVKGKRGDERTDIYALGAILYEMATGATPFEGRKSLRRHERPRDRRSRRPAQGQSQADPGRGGDHSPRHGARSGGALSHRRGHEGGIGRLRESRVGGAFQAPANAPTVEKPVSARCL